MKVYLVSTGDGYGHNTLHYVSCDEDKAREKANELGGWVEEEELHDLGGLHAQFEEARKRW